MGWAFGEQLKLKPRERGQRLEIQMNGKVRVIQGSSDKREGERKSPTTVRDEPTGSLIRIRVGQVMKS